MTLRVTRRLGGYTQWVRLRAPTGKKLHQVQSTFIYTDKEETLRMTHRVTRRLGGYCRENYPRVYQSPRFDAIDRRPTARPPTAHLPIEQCWLLHADSVAARAARKGYAPTARAPGRLLICWLPVARGLAARKST